ncbi:hypothetical protein B0T19DRAFT_426942 [Cercophora scortea]|uniref:Zn(2)-C6 fungal-type domain-containing protein n=1 Tax=Cercophora scortea TaxID=314031 RepID=A0AAE0IF56_9PEZI|nr:hypothetical protein B0T19DRAFT_426942 [Cercophora scortea]
MSLANSDFVSYQPQRKRPQTKQKPSAGPSILTFALQHRPKTTRASGPKVRSGCSTCEKRHVKCDEAKPSCQRCIKWQGFCDGYAAQPQRSSPSSPSPRPAERNAKCLTEIAKDRLALLTEPDFNNGVFKHQWERAYFDHFQILSENIGGGFFHTNLFSQTIPQLCHDEPAIRYAAIAIGALANAKAPNMLPRSSNALIGENSPHYKLAITYYGWALRIIHGRKGPSNDDTLRAALIACILFTCFETMHGSREAAINHINHGLVIVEHFMQSQRRKSQLLELGDYQTDFLHTQSLIQQYSPPSPYHLHPTNSPSPSELFQTPTNNTGSPSGSSSGFIKYGERSPAPLVLEDEILQIFQRLDYQSWTTGLQTRWRRGPRMHLRAMGNHSPNDIPTNFAELVEARRWWDLVQHWALHFPRAAIEQLMMLSGNGLEIDPNVFEVIDYCDIPELKAMQDQNLGILERWRTAFLPLYTVARDNQKTDPAAFFQAVSLMLQFHVSWMGVRTACFSDYNTLYMITPRFKEMVRLSEILLANQPKPAGSTEVFTMDNGPTLALMLSATKCRDYNVREEAIAILKRYPRTDAFWTSRAAAALGESNQFNEEENEKHGTLAEQFWRLRRREGIMADRKNECLGFWWGRNPDTGEWTYQSRMVEW